MDMLEGKVAESSRNSTMTWCCGWRQSMKRARAVARFSRLALFAGLPLRGADANPVILRQNGVVAVDALAVLKEE